MTQPPDLCSWKTEIRRTKTTYNSSLPSVSNSVIAYKWQVRRDNTTLLFKNTFSVVVTIIPLPFPQVEYSSFLLSDYPDCNSATHVFNMFQRRGSSVYLRSQSWYAFNSRRKMLSYQHPGSKAAWENTRCKLSDLLSQKLITSVSNWLLPGSILCI